MAVNALPSVVVEQQLPPQQATTPVKADPFPKPFFTEVSDTGKLAWEYIVQKVTDMKDGLLALVTKVINFISGCFESKKPAVVTPEPILKAVEPAKMTVAVTTETQLAVVPQLKQEEQQAVIPAEKVPQVLAAALQLVQPAAQQKEQVEQKQPVPQANGSPVLVPWQAPASPPVELKKWWWF